MLRLEKDLREAYRDEYDNQTRSSVMIALSIAMLAHINQRRLDGTMYYTHPYMVAESYKDLVCMRLNNFDCDKLIECGVPFYGALEVCWLHDVLEDSDYTEEEIGDIYRSKDFEEYYKRYIKKPLLLITHEKDEPYSQYIDDVCLNSTSALVKLLDLRDNLDPMSLDKLGDKELTRAQDYYKYLKVINDKYHFIEKIQLFRKTCIKDDYE